jgi:hypothetical protein
MTSGFDLASHELSDNLGMIPFLPPGVDGFRLFQAVWIEASRNSVQSMLTPLDLDLINDCGEVKTDTLESKVRGADAKDPPPPDYHICRTHEKALAAHVAATLDGDAAGGAKAKADTTQTSTLSYYLTNGAKTSIGHGTHLEEFLKKNISTFIFNNTRTSQAFRSSGKNKYTRKLLGFVSSCRTGKLTAKTTTDTTTTATASAEAPGGSGSLRASKTSKDTKSTKKTEGVVGIHLYFAYLERRPNDPHNMYHELVTVSKLNDENLREAQCWVRFGRLRRLYDKMVGQVTTKELPTSFVIPSPGQDDDEVDEWDGVAMREAGRLGGNILELQDQRMNAVATLVRNDTAEDDGNDDGASFENSYLGFEGTLMNMQWRSSHKVLITSTKVQLSAFHETLKKDGYIALSPPGTRMVHMAPAFVLSPGYLLPVVCQTVEAGAPTTLLCYSDGYEYLTPLQGGGSGGVLASFHDGKWEMLDEHVPVDKDDSKTISDLKEKGFLQVAPDAVDHRDVNTKTHLVMARQELAKIPASCDDVFRGAAEAAPMDQELSTTEPRVTTETAALPNNVTGSFASPGQKRKAAED